jgi:hypothetical protein
MVNLHKNTCEEDQILPKARYHITYHLSFAGNILQLRNMNNGILKSSVQAGCQ